MKHCEKRSSVKLVVQTTNDYIWRLPIVAVAVKYMANYSMNKIYTWIHSHKHNGIQFSLVFLKIELDWTVLLTKSSTNTSALLSPYYKCIVERQPINILCAYNNTANARVVFIISHVKAFESFLYIVWLTYQKYVSVTTLQRQLCGLLKSYFIRKWLQCLIAKTSFINLI